MPPLHSCSLCQLLLLCFPLSLSLSLSLTQVRKIEAELAKAAEEQTTYVGTCIFSQKECSMCLSKLLLDTPGLTALECGHVYHTVCIKLYVSRGNLKCPQCDRVLQEQESPLKRLRSA